MPDIMASATLSSNLNSPMGTAHVHGSSHLGVVGSLTSQTDIKYELHSPLLHSQSPSMTTSTPTPSSTPNSIMSNSTNGKSNSKEGNENGSLIIGPSNSHNSELFGSKCKRKINFSHLGIPKGHNQPATVARRNERERKRVKQVNTSFASLKQHIPPPHRSKKMSKVETLRCAVEYIKTLKGMLDINGALLSTSSSSTGSSISSVSSSGSESEQTQGGQSHFTGDGFAPDPFHPHHLSHQLHHHQTQLQQQQHQQQAQQGHHALPPFAPAASHQLSPTSSEDPSSPSYASEASSYITSSSKFEGAIYDYENYEPVSPEDDELLDAISWWQQS